MDLIVVYVRRRTSPMARPRRLRRIVSIARRGRRHGWRHRLARDLRYHAVLFVAVAALLTAVTAPAVGADMVTPLPAVSASRISPAGLPQDLLITDRNGKLLSDIGNQGNHRVVVPLGAMSPFIVEATIAIEDRTFYSNTGIDPLAIGRAAIDDLLHHQIVQGGSTITQQLAKQLFIGPVAPATLQRKLKEAILAIRLTQHFSKGQILEAYLNTIYYSNQAYGIQAAAQSYFHTDAAHLTLAQASLLAGIPRAPTAYNPLLNPVAARQRQLQVLAAMVKQGNITSAESNAAAASRVTVYPPTTTALAPHFVSYVLGVLRSQFHITPGSTSAVRVVTSLDLNLQGAAETAVKQQISNHGDFYNFHDAALVSLDPRTGEILAMVGSAPGNRSTGAINMAVSPTRQVGSAFKIFTYTAAIESRKLTMVSPILDAPLAFPIGGANDGPYVPLNYDLRWHGVVPLKVALGNSLNIPGIKAELYTGIGAVLATARRMGVTTLTEPDQSYGPSLTLGAYPVPVIDMAEGAATLADMGVRHPPIAIIGIFDAFGRKRYAYDPPADGDQAVSAQAAYIMSAILSDDRNRWMEFGVGGDLTLPGHQVAAKTGTSQDFRDNWTVGYTPTLATAVWTGNPNGTPLSHSSTGIVGAAPIWHQYMSAALAQVPNQWYPVPPGLDEVGGDFFLPGTESLPARLAQPWPVCPFFTYDPNRLTWDNLLIDGLPCTLGTRPQKAVDLFR